MGCLYSKTFISTEEIHVRPKLKIKIPLDISTKEKRLISKDKKPNYYSLFYGV